MEWNRKDINRQVERLYNPHKAFKDLFFLNEGMHAWKRQHWIDTLLCAFQKHMQKCFQICPQSGHSTLGISGNEIIHDSIFSSI